MRRGRAMSAAPFALDPDVRRDAGMSVPTTTWVRIC